MYNSYLLTVTKDGTGTGIVSASTGTFLWIGNTGTAVYPDYGMQVTLHAAASGGSTFAGWSGEGCSGTGDCTVTMTAARNVNATFTVYTYVLTVTKTGKGSGTVEVAPGVLTWAGKTGTATYNYNTQVTLTPTADPGSTFTGWSGEGCSGTGNCMVIMTVPRAVDAAFNK